MIPKGEIRRTAPDLGGDREDLDADKIVDGVSIEDARIANGDFSGRSLRKITVQRSVIEAVSFARAGLLSFRFRDVRFVGCDLSNTVLSGVEANRVEFIECRLIGMKAIECRMKDILLEQCDSRYAQFNNGVLKASDFTDTELQEADFRAANLENTRWIRSNLSRADLTDARLKSADLCESVIDGLVVNALDVSGAIVNPSQAMDLARLLGLVIR